MVLKSFHQLFAFLRALVEAIHLAEKRTPLVVDFSQNAYS